MQLPWRHIKCFLLLLVASGALPAQDDELYIPGAITAKDTAGILYLLRQADDGGERDEPVLEALAMARSIGYTSGMKKALGILLNREMRRGNSVSALRYALEWQQVLEKENATGELAALYLAIARIYEREQLYSNAIQYAEKAEKLVGQSTPDIDKIIRWKSLAGLYLKNRNAGDAAAYYQKLLVYFEKKGDYPETLQALQGLSEAAELRADFQLYLSFNIKIQNLAIARGDDATVALASNNLGYGAHRLGQYQTAVAGFEDAERYSLRHPGVLDRAAIYTNLAIAWYNLGDQAKAIENIQKAKQFHDGKLDISYLDHLAATIYFKKGDIYNALKYNDIALSEAKAANQPEVLSDAYGTAANIYEQLFEYEKALEYYKKHLALKDSLLFRERARIQALENQQYILEKTEREMRLQLANQELQASENNRLTLQNDKLRLEVDKSLLETSRREKEVELLKKNEDVRVAQLRNAELLNRQTQQTLALTRQQLLASRQSQEIASLSQQQKLAAFELEKQKAEEDRAQQQIKLLEGEKKISALELSRQQSFRNTAYWIGALLGIILLLTVMGLLFGRRLNRRLREKNLEVESQKQAVELERARAESLLLNVLPEQTARELQATGKATPRKYGMVSVMFTDFSNFTKIAEKIPPDELIGILNTCFTAFDEIADRYNLEKIKTIGDSYMCAGGLPDPNLTNAVDAVGAAREILGFMHSFNDQQRKEGRPVFLIRIGIHTGEVAAGVVGAKKFAYDIWGDTVNVASRLESNCPPESINISETTYQIVKDRFKCHYRGKFAVKNKGEEMGMYAVLMG